MNVDANPGTLMIAPAAVSEALITHPLAAVLDVGFQPIVDIHTGRVFGFEALMRNVGAAGYASPVALLDARAAAGDLPEVEAAVVAKAFAAFAAIEGHRNLKLFINLDGRTIAAGEPIRSTLAALKKRHRLSNANLAIEVTERFDFNTHAVGFQALLDLRAEFGSLTLDDFGSGHANLQMLYHVEPNILKLDRFIISSIGSDPKKVVFLQHIVKMAHLLGSLVVAEGVETAQEYFVCRELGCDLVQGYAVARPTVNIADLEMSYSTVVAMLNRDRRKKDTDFDLVMGQLEEIAPLEINQEIDAVFDRFRDAPDRSFFPVVDEVGMPFGLIHERDLKDILYSKYGRELLKNRHRKRQWPLKNFVRPCAVASINASAEKILEVFASRPDSEGVMIAADSRYRGFLHARALLRIINEKNLQMARDQNPLTKLPGNIMIQEYLAEAAEPERAYHFAYLDFDYFKPFNDTYGFRTGDRAILMCAEILRAAFNRQGRFVGHVGGDDFFVGFADTPADEAVGELQAVLAKFRNDVESLYGAEDRRNGYISATSREGRKVRFPLLTISGAVIHKLAGRPMPPIDHLSATIAEAKKAAKLSAEKIVRVAI
jgi:diguanylate cyclase (GGDEF)-like protein